jgi:hypothetical protein
METEGSEPRTDDSTQDAEEKTDREEGGPTSPAEETGDAEGGAAGTKPTPGLDPHE